MDNCRGVECIANGLFDHFRQVMGTMGFEFPSRNNMERNYLLLAIIVDVYVMNLLYPFYRKARLDNTVDQLLARSFSQQLIDHGPQ